jgi:hypothetical protein
MIIIAILAFVASVIAGQLIAAKLLEWERQ